MNTGQPNTPPETHTQPGQSNRESSPATHQSKPNSWITRFTMVRSQRSLENLFLNIALYLGSLLILSAAALLVNSVGTAPVQIALLTLLTCLIYSTGIATYQWVPRLRLASYSFTSTGLALIPFCGIATYKLIWPFSGTSLWLIVSLIGTVAVTGALLLMQARVMAYLALAFVVSDVLAISKTLQVGMIWYFISLLLLACALEFFTTLTRRRLPHQLRHGFRDSSRVFVPLTMTAALCASRYMELWELGLIFTAGTIYSLVFLTVDVPLVHFIEGRVYSFLAMCFFTGISLTSENPPLIFKSFYLPALLLLISVVVLLLVKVPLPRYNQRLDAAITYGIAQLFLFHSLHSINTVFQLGSFFPEIYQYDPQENGTFFALTLVFLLLTLNGLALGLLSQDKRLRPFLQLFGVFQIFLMFYTLSWAGVLFGLLCQAAVTFSLYHQQSKRKVVAFSFPFLLAATAILVLPDFFGALPLFAFYILGLGCAVRYLYAVMSYPLSAGRLANHLRLTYYFVAFMGLTFPFLCISAIWGNDLIYREHLDVARLIISCAEAIFIGVIFSSLCIAISRSYYTATVTVQQKVESPENQFPERYQRLLEGTSQHMPSDATPQFINTTVDVTKAPLLMLTAFYISVFMFWLSLPVRYSITQELIVLSGMSLSIIAMFPYTSIKARVHYGIVARSLLVWVGYRTLLSGDVTTELQILLICAILALLAVTSLLIHRFSEGGHQKTETSTALVFSLLSLTASLPFIAQDTSGITWYHLMCVAILLVLMGTWTMVPRQEITVMVQALILFHALTLLLFPLTATAQGTFSSYGILAIGASIVIVAKLCAVYMPEIVPTTTVQVPNYLGKWGHQHNRAIAFSGLSYGSLLLLLAFIGDSLFVALIVATLLTLGWALHVKASQQPLVLITGMNLALLRVLIDIQFENSLFYICQAIVMSLSMMLLLSKIAIFAEHQKPRQELFWVAAGLQGSLVLTLPGFIGNLSFLDRALMIVISGLLLGASSVFRRALQPVLMTILLTYQVLYLLGGLNVITLFLFGFLLIGIVVWRLLARKDEPEDVLPPTTAPRPQHPPVTPGTATPQNLGGYSAQSSTPPAQ